MTHQAPSTLPRPRLEVHTHCDIRTGVTHRHSHHGFTEAPHGHGFGPACLVIDRDTWYRQTGLRGGGRKHFTTRPVGPQYPDTDKGD